MDSKWLPVFQGKKYNHSPKWMKMWSEWVQRRRVGLLQRWCMCKVSGQVTSKVFFPIMTKGRRSKTYPTMNERPAWIHGEWNGHLEDISFRVSVSCGGGSRIIAPCEKCRCIRHNRLEGVGFELRRQSTDWETMTEIWHSFGKVWYRERQCSVSVPGELLTSCDSCQDPIRMDSATCIRLSGSEQVPGQEWRLTQESEGETKIHHTG